jgi:hypothetical protein
MASISDINSIPKKYIPVPFANGADSAYVNNIPQTRASGDPQNKATWNVGFPPITMQQINVDGTGGIPPSGADMNCVLNTLSSHAYTAQYGVSYDWDSNIASNFGGYPSGAIVAYPIGNNANKTLYLSLQENNTSNPTSGTWKKLYQDYIIDSGMSGTGDNIYWYRQYNSGWCEEGGTIRIYSSNTRIDQTIPLKIKNCVYANIIPSMKSRGDDNDFGISVEGVPYGLACYIYFNNPVNGKLQAFWEAKGYI